MVFAWSSGKVRPAECPAQRQNASAVLDGNLGGTAHGERRSRACALYLRGFHSREMRETHGWIWTVIHVYAGI